MTAATAGGLDLPADLQRELTDLAAREGRISHYELLGITADADGGAVRRAYLERSRRLHPDAWYRKDLGEFGPLLSRAFQRISAAYQVLSDAESRAEYDRENLQAFSSTERAHVEKQLAGRQDDERRAAERRERLLRSKGFARLGAARQLYEGAIAHAADGQRGLAIAELKAARELDPQRKEIVSKLAALEKEASKARAASACLAARDREAQGQLDQAIALFTAAHQNDPANPDAALGAARCAVEKADWQLATSWGQRAMEVQPQNPELRLILARAWGALKNKARAKAELLQILNKNPNHEEAKALMKSL